MLPLNCLTFSDVLQRPGSCHDAKMDTGVQLVSAMWALTVLSLVLVALRLYTRIRIVKFVGSEDHLYA